MYGAASSRDASRAQNAAISASRGSREAAPPWRKVAVRHLAALFWRDQYTLRLRRGGALRSFGRVERLLPGAEITISAGVAERAPTEAREWLLQRADEALYRAKSMGRDRVEFNQASAP